MNDGHSEQQRPNPPSIGDIIEVEIDKLVAGGEGLGRTGGMVVFARPAYPGDLVRVRVSEAKKRFVRGPVVELVRRSPERRLEPCPIAESCGGCDWTSYRLDAQLRAKQQIVGESIRRIGKLEGSSVPPIRVHASPLNYRLRSRLHCDDSGRVGFYELRSHCIVPIVPECEVVGPLLREVISRGEINGEPGSDVVLVENEHQLIRRDCDDSAPRTLMIPVRDHDFEISTESFFQVNRHLLGLLSDLVLSHADGLDADGRALDLYGGAGFFAVPLSHRFTHVVTVEHDAEGHRLALKNVSSLPVEAVQADVLEYLRKERDRPDFVFLDPPRSGVHSGIIDELDRLDPTIISYLSCDPVHLARDLSRFQDRGWAPITIDMIDLFPNTHHIETLVSLRRS